MPFRIPPHALAALSPHDWTRAVPEDPEPAQSVAALLHQMAVLARRSLPGDSAVTAVEGLHQVALRYHRDTAPVAARVGHTSGPRQVAELVFLAALSWLFAVRVRYPVAEVVCAELGRRTWQVLHQLSAGNQPSLLWQTQFRVWLKYWSFRVTHQQSRGLAVLGSRGPELVGCVEHYSAEFLANTRSENLRANIPADRAPNSLAIL